MKTIVFITHGRALYSRRGRRIQLMKNGVVGTAKQVVDGTVQPVGKKHKGLARWWIFGVFPACNSARRDAKLFYKRIWLRTSKNAHLIESLPKYQKKDLLFVQKHESH